MAAEALEQSVLEAKDKDQLLAIAKALGVKASARTKKSDLIDQILETTGSSSPRPLEAPAATDAAGAQTADDGNGPGGGLQATTPTIRSTAAVEDAEPLAEWELELDDGADDDRDSDGPSHQSMTATPSARQPGSNGPGRPAPAGQPAGATGQSGFTAVGAQDQGAGQAQGQGDGEGESRNRRRRRRRKGANRGPLDGPQGDDAALAPVDDDADEAEPASSASFGEPVNVDGYLDMRDEGYGFLRVNGYLPTRDDAYVPLKLARQYGLRKGDHLTGTSRTAGRNEKNPALLNVLSVNGGEPEAARRRPRFEDLTALFPDQPLRLENPSDPTNMTARIIDLVAPIGKGQRGIIVSPPKAGKTFVMKTIATSIERNNPEVKLIVLLIDERPEEVTDIRRTVRGEVIASTFDRPSEEHTHIAELAIEKAKRLVEQGDDVVIILDGITRLSRAYNLAAPPSGRILSGGIDAGALYPPKKFFGAARNVEEGGSLTILATALVDTNSRMDEAIFEEFKGTGNMELRLDRRLAERRVYPAIDIDASSTRHEELLFDRRQLQMVWKLRRVLSGLAADGNSAPGLELLMDRLKTFRTNEEFLSEIASQAHL